MTKPDPKDAVAIAGVLVFLAGVGLIYWPAALIIAGLLLFSWAFITSKSEVPPARLE